MVGQRTRKIASPESHIRSNDKNSEQHKIASLFAVEIINYSNEEKGKDCERTKLDTSMCSASFDWRSCERPCQRRLFSRNLFEICSVWRAQKKSSFLSFLCLYVNWSTEATIRTCWIHVSVVTDAQTTGVSVFDICVAYVANAIVIHKILILKIIVKNKSAQMMHDRKHARKLRGDIIQRLFHAMPK